MDLDKIIKGLEICAEDCECEDCPYYEGADCLTKIKYDAIAAIKELRAKGKLQKASAAVEGVVDEATMGAITEMRSEIEAQAQAIETLQAINAKLEGKVEAYEYALRLAIE